MHALLEADRISKSFGPVRAVDGVSLRIAPGEIYGLLGPNGAGKTTSLSMICGLLRPDAGQVVLDGVPFHADPQRARRLLGVVPQEIALYEELSGRENLVFWGRLAGLQAAEARGRAEGLLAALQLADRAGDPVRTYSGGMKRRVNLGAALLHRPRLLLLDEPTVGIDPQARASVLDFIRQQAVSGTAILYTTHYLEEAEAFCQRIGIIDQGRLLAEGTLAELQQRVGGDHVYTIEGRLDGARPEEWPGFLERYRVLQQSGTHLVVAATKPRDPVACLQDLLSLPVQVQNAALKRPSLNDVFLQLTGRRLRE